MGIIKSKLTRPLKTYNVEYRAHKIINNKEKRKAAPYYPSVHEQIKVAKEANPSFMEEHYKKDVELYERLKQVFVTSNILCVPEFQPTSNRPLPKSTRTPEILEFGYWEPKEVPDGRCHLKEILTFLVKHLAQPKKYTTEIVAAEYKIDVKDVENILRYYRVLQIIEPKKTTITYSDPDKNIGLPEINEQGKLEWDVTKLKLKEKEEEEKMMKYNKIDEKIPVIISTKKNKS